MPPGRSRSGRTRRSGRSGRSRAARARGTRPRPTGPTRSGRQPPRCGLAAAPSVLGAGSWRVFYNTAVPKTLRDRSRAESRCVYDPPGGASPRAARRPGGRGRRAPARRRHAQGDRAARLPRGRGRLARPRLARRAALARLRPRARPRGAAAHAVDAAHGARRPLADDRSATTSRSSATGVSCSDVDEARRARRRGRFRARAARARSRPVPRRLRAARLDRFDDWQQLTGGHPDARARRGARPRRRRARGAGD